MKFLTNVSRDESGATAIEYGLIAALIAVALITLMQTFGDSQDQAETEVATEATLGADGQVDQGDPAE